MAPTFVFTLCLARITLVEDQATCLASVHCLWECGECGEFGECGEGGRVGRVGNVGRVEDADSDCGSERGEGLML